ncbi:alpha/beta fold hydrolase [Parathermosynechococcus lividus]
MTSTLSAMAAFPTADWQWRGHRIRYSISGTGAPVVLVHGFGASIGHWRKTIPALREAGYRVYALDLLGFGASAKPNLAYSMDLWAELLADFWQAHIGEPVVWVGNSIGGLLCLRMAADYGHTCRGVSVLNCAGGLNHRPNELNWMQTLFTNLFRTLVAAPVIGHLIFDQIRRPERIRKTLGQVYANPDAITDELVELLHRPALDAGAKEVFARVISAPPGPKIVDLLPAIQVPILVLWGEVDPWTPVSGVKHFEAHQERIPIRIERLADTGHCPHDDRPELVNPILVEWLQQLGSKF